MGTMLMTLLLIMAVVLFLWQLSNMISIIWGSPFVGSKIKVARQAFSLAGLKKDDVFYELGCGTANISIEAAKLGAKVKGFEISPFYFLISKIKSLLIKNIFIELKNITEINFKKVDIIYCFLLPNLLEKLAPKFKRELKKTARVISIGFPIPSLKLIYEEGEGLEKIFIYKK